MTKEFRQRDWDAALEDNCRQIVRLAVREDLDQMPCDLTTRALIDERSRAVAAMVARQAGIVAGVRAVEIVLDEMNFDLAWSPELADGDPVGAGHTIGTLRGSACHLLSCERIVLNLVGRLSGIASRTRQFVQAVKGRHVGIYDTRKTTPGWRRLEKFAVRCGGGRNHRSGLFDAVLIKDNHLALGRTEQADWGPAEAIRRARERLPELVSDGVDPADVILEVEVDTFEQLDQALAARPDIILLDNMTPQEMAEAVRRRDSVAPDVQLEASGGIDLVGVAEVAASGVERISVGGLTHAAVSLDIGLDWRDSPDENSGSG